MLPNPQFPADLVTFTEETLNAKLPFVCSAIYGWNKYLQIKESSANWIIIQPQMTELSKDGKTIRSADELKSYLLI